MVQIDKHKINALLKQHDEANKHLKKVVKIHAHTDADKKDLKKIKQRTDASLNSLKAMSNFVETMKKKPRRKSWRPQRPKEKRGKR